MDTITLTGGEVRDAYHDLRDIRVTCSSGTSALLRLLADIPDGRGCTLSVEEEEDEEEDDEVGSLSPWGSGWSDQEGAAVRPPS